MVSLKTECDVNHPEQSSDVTYAQNVAARLMTGELIKAGVITAEVVENPLFKNHPRAKGMRVILNIDVVPPEK